MDIEDLAEELKDLLNRGLREGVDPVMAANLVLHTAFIMAADYHGDDAMGARDLKNGVDQIVKQHGGDVVH